MVVVARPSLEVSPVSTWYHRISFPSGSSMSNQLITCPFFAFPTSGRWSRLRPRADKRAQYAGGRLWAGLPTQGVRNDVTLSLERDRAVFRLACRLVDVDDNPTAGGLGVDERESGRGGPIGEETLAVA